MTQEEKLGFLLNPNLGVLALINQALVDGNWGVEWMDKEEFKKQYGETDVIIRMAK